MAGRRYERTSSLFLLHQLKCVLVPAVNLDLFVFVRCFFYHLGKMKLKSCFAFFTFAWALCFMNSGSSGRNSARGFAVASVNGSLPGEVVLLQEGSSAHRMGSQGYILELQGEGLELAQRVSLQQAHTLLTCA